MGTDIHANFQKRIGDSWDNIETEWEQRRHYLLFAWLADVRNGFGFAGTPTHEPLVPLQVSRGLPADVLETMDDYEYGDHSFGWLLASEILAGKLPTIRKTGIVTREAFEAWDRKSEPDGWCGGISGPGIVVQDELGGDDKATHVSIRWSKDLADELSYFVDEVKRLADLHGADNVRLVFGFDN